jgi:hypothetical protein
MADHLTTWRRWVPLLAAATLALATVSAIALAPAAAGGQSPLERNLQAARTATARYHSFAQAEKDGYTIAGEPCVVSPAGTMGIHAVNPALMADDAINPLQPEILLYVRDKHGHLRLVGVEYFKPDADQNLATAGDQPSLFGVPFDGPMPGHNPTMPIHYDLHVWLWAENPSGVFAPFNPSLTCGS